MSFDIKPTTTLNELGQEFLVRKLKLEGSLYVFSSDIEFYYYLPVLIDIGVVSIVKRYPLSNTRYKFRFIPNIQDIGFDRHTCANEADQYKNCPVGSYWRQQGIGGWERYEHIFESEWPFIIKKNTPLFNMLWSLPQQPARLSSIIS